MYSSAGWVRTTGPDDGILLTEGTSQYLPHNVPVGVVVVAVCIHSNHLCYTAETDSRSSGNYQIGNKPC